MTEGDNNLGRAALRKLLCGLLIVQLVVVPPFPQAAQAQINPDMAAQGVKYDVTFDITGADPNDMVSVSYTPGTTHSERADRDGILRVGSRVDYTEIFNATIETTIADIPNEINIDWKMEGVINVTGRASRSASVRVTLGATTKSVIADNSGNFDLGYMPAIENMTQLISGLQVNVINTRCVRGDCAPVNPAGLNISLNSIISYDEYTLPPGTPPPTPGASSSQVGSIMGILSLLGISLGSLGMVPGAFATYSASRDAVEGAETAADVSRQETNQTANEGVAVGEAAVEEVARFEVHPDEVKQATAGLQLAQGQMESRGNYTGLAQILYERQVGMYKEPYVREFEIPSERIAFFFSNYCNSEAYEGVFAERCAGVTGDRVDADIKSDAVLSKRNLTLDVSFRSNEDGATPAAGAGEKDVLSFLYNVLTFQAPDYRRHMPFNEAQRASWQPKALAAMSLNTLHSFARNSWAHLIGMRAKGSKTVDELGIPELLADYNVDMAQYRTVLGKKPSYYAQLEFAARKLYQDPQFHASLMNMSDIRALRSRKAMIKSLRLQVDREIYKSMLRVETLLVALNEMKLREARR